MPDDNLRADILRIAQSWIDTPYQHQSSCKGVGTDCLGLIRGVWREIYGQEPEAPPPYTPDWAEQCGEETLRDAARRWLNPIDVGHAHAGDVVLFRMQSGAPCKHIGILSAPDLMIHAYWGPAVVESYLVPYWQRRAAHYFAFPAMKRPIL